MYWVRTETIRPVKQTAVQNRGCGVGWSAAVFWPLCARELGRCIHLSLTAALLHSTVRAISGYLNRPSMIISRMRPCCEAATFGAISISKQRETASRFLFLLVQSEVSQIHSRIFLVLRDFAGACAASMKNWPIIIWRSVGIPKAQVFRVILPHQQNTS